MLCFDRLPERGGSVSVSVCVCVCVTYRPRGQAEFELKGSWGQSFINDISISSHIACLLLTSYHTLTTSRICFLLDFAVTYGVGYC